MKIPNWIKNLFAEDVEDDSPSGIDGEAKGAATRDRRRRDQEARERRTQTKLTAAAEGNPKAENWLTKKLNRYFGG